MVSRIARLGVLVPEEYEMVRLVRTLAASGMLARREELP
jgi:hypothetical protein